MPLSIRFDETVMDRLRRATRATPGATVSGLAQRLVDEGLRMTEHPGVVFKDGPSGRRAALVQGPDLWEVMKTLRELDERGPVAVEAAAELLNLSSERIESALRYYGAHRAEIEAEIAQADDESAEAEEAWAARQRLLG